MGKNNTLENFITAMTAPKADGVASLGLSISSNNNDSNDPNVTVRDNMIKCLDYVSGSGYGSNQVRVADGTFINNRMHTGAADLNISDGRFQMNMLTWDRYTIMALYHGCWIFRRIIDKVAQDEWSAGITINCDCAPEDLNRIYKRLGRARSEMIYATEQCRLFGGAASLMMVDDGETDLSKPLNLHNIKKGATLRFLTTDRWYGLETSDEMVTNYKNSEFGKPKYYTFYTGNVLNTPQDCSIKVHHSRVLRFVNRRAPRLIEQLLMGWGVSEIEHIYQDIMNHENTKNSTASLLNKALLEIVKVSGLRSLMSGLTAGNAAQQAVLTGSLTGITEYRTSNNLVMLDSDDDYQRETYSFSGLSEILISQKDIIAGAAEMPQVLIFGDTKGGLSSDSPAEMEFYATTIRGKQDEQIRPVLDKLLPVLFRIEGLEIPKDLDYDFESVAGTSDEKKNSKISTIISNTMSLYDSGLISGETALEEIKQFSKMTGFGTNITDRDMELVKKADKEAKEAPPENEQVSPQDEDFLDAMPNTDYEEEKKKVLIKPLKFRDRFKKEKQ